RRRLAARQHAGHGRGGAGPARRARRPALERFPQGAAQRGDPGHRPAAGLRHPLIRPATAPSSPPSPSPRIRPACRRQTAGIVPVHGSAVTLGTGRRRSPMTIRQPSLRPRCGALRRPPPLSLVLPPPPPTPCPPP